jgi:hypothetical protein
MRVFVGPRFAFKMESRDKGMASDRRTFLAQGALVLAGITSGTLTPMEAMMNTKRREFLKQISPFQGRRNRAILWWVSAGKS